MQSKADALLFTPRLPPCQVEIIVGERLLEKPKKRQTVLIADATVAKLHKDRLHIADELLLFEGGEKAKTREVKQQLEDALLERKVGRDALLIALGGGVVCDLVGYLASTYMRGVAFFLVPTTLLAMADAALGGKTGVNTPRGKNLIGSFSFPQAVYIDPSFLSTLPEEEWQNGLAEILKCALAAEKPLWNLCKGHASDWKTPPILHEILLTAIRTKLRIVEEDPLDQSGRIALNFGHTFAHALEQASHYEMPHGHAVAFGCLIESHLSYHLSSLSKESLKEIESVYRALGFSLSLPKQIDFEALLLDKKRKGDKLRLPCLSEIGRCSPRLVSLDDVHMAKDAWISL